MKTIFVSYSVFFLAASFVLFYDSTSLAQDSDTGTDADTDTDTDGDADTDTGCTPPSVVVDDWGTACTTDPDPSKSGCPANTRCVGIYPLANKWGDPGFCSPACCPMEIDTESDSYAGDEFCPSVAGGTEFCALELQDSWRCIIICDEDSQCPEGLTCTQTPNNKLCYPGTGSSDSDTDTDTDTDTDADNDTDSDTEQDAGGNGEKSKGCSCNAVGENSIALTGLLIELARSLF